MCFLTNSSLEELVALQFSIKEVFLLQVISVFHIYNCYLVNTQLPFIIPSWYALYSFKWNVSKHLKEDWACFWTFETVY